MTPAGKTLSARLTRVAVPMLLATLTLGACSDDEPDTSASASGSTSPSTSQTPSPTPSMTTPSVTPTPTSTPTQTPSPTPTVTLTSPPVASPTPTRTQPVSCPASKAGAANTAGMSAASAAKARKILAAAKACDAATLIALAKADMTGLAGEQVPAAIFTKSAPQNFVALATLLTMEPTETFDGTIQPKVFSERYAQDDAEWGKVVAAGLLTRAAATKMRQNDGGYTGYRVGLARDGTWTFFTSGR